jgi:hypothetical protein
VAWRGQRVTVSEFPRARRQLGRNGFRRQPHRVLALEVAMSQTVKVLHPRKLYSMLVACPTSETRAATALEFLRGCTVASGGFLFLARAEQTELAAACQKRDVPAGMADEVARIWRQKKRAPGADQTTIGVSGSLHRLRPEETKAAWVSPSGEAFEHRMLSVDRAGRWVPVGLAMLAVPQGGNLLPLRHVHVTALCEALLDAGDVVPAAPDPAIPEL